MLNSLEGGRGQPQPSLSLLDGIGAIVGIVVGAGIFRTPSLVAANVRGETEFLLIWALGGVISLLGASCYAELATAYPHAGGEYHYLSRALGKKVAFLFAWARLSVIQTGSIALLAFLVGDYLSQLLPVGSNSPSIYAAFTIALLTALNVAGIQLVKWVQNGLTAAKLLGLACVVVAGLAMTAPPVAAAVPATSGQQPEPAFGLAAIFVLLTYGGWSEAAYLSAELRQAERNMAAALIVSISLIAGIFLLVNVSYLKGLGLAGIAQSEAVAADLLRRAVGEGGAQFVSLLIAVSALGAMNGTILTGARTNYAWGQDVKLLRFLAYWHPRTQTPTRALLVQGAMTLGLVGLGSLTRAGFATMVEYTAPVFWFFLLLVGISLFLLRRQESAVPRSFSVPFYPLTPLLFCGTCLYLLGASLADTGVGAWVGIAVLLLGMPLSLLAD